MQTEEHKNNVELQRIHQQNKLRLSQLARNLIENYEGVYPSAFEDPNTAQETLKTREIYRNGIAYMKRTGDYTPNHHSRQIPQTEDLQLNQTEQDKLLANRAGFYRAFVEMLKLEYGRNIEKGECKAHFEKVLAHLQKLKALSGRLIEWEAPSGVEIAAYGFQPQFSEARNRPKKIEENPAEVPHAQPAITVPSRRPSGGFRGIRDILFRRGQ